MKREAFDHSKMKRLCRRMDIPLWQGVGLLESIWRITAVECPRGDLGRLSDEDIALAIDYRGDESKLIDGLVLSGWVDKSPEHRLIVHDWWEHADDSVHAKLARKRQHFVTGQAPKLSRLYKPEREEAEKFYESSEMCSGSQIEPVPPTDVQNDDLYIRELGERTQLLPGSQVDPNSVRTKLENIRTKPPNTALPVPVPGIKRKNYTEPAAAAGLDPVCTDPKKLQPSPPGPGKIRRPEFEPIEPSPLGDAVERMLRLHPWGTDPGEAFFAIKGIIESAVQPEEVLRSSEVNHGLWVEYWAQRGAETGRTPFIPTLTVFFREGHHARKPPIRGGSAPLTRQEVKLEKDRAAVRAGLEMFDKIRKVK